AIEADEDLDVIAGSAGVMVALLALERAGSSERALELARRCGERLLSRARQTANGLIWVNIFSGGETPTRFGHRASGIPHALLLLADRTGDESARLGARYALRAERRHLEPAIERGVADGPESQATTLSAHAERTLSTSWCHGFAGLALARLEAGDLDPQLAGDRDEWLRIVEEHGFGRSHCLCHGDLGSLDILDRASRRSRPPGAASVTPALARRVAGVLDSAAELGWRCGTMSEVEAPGLMNGLAGIG